MRGRFLYWPIFCHFLSFSVNLGHFRFISTIISNLWTEILLSHWHATYMFCLFFVCIFAFCFTLCVPAGSNETWLPHRMPTVPLIFSVYLSRCHMFLVESLQNKIPYIFKTFVKQFSHLEDQSQQNKIPYIFKTFVKQFPHLEDQSNSGAECRSKWQTCWRIVEGAEEGKWRCCSPGGPGMEAWILS